MMAAIRPTQFSALKVLNHLHEEEERSEDDNGHRDDQQVIHGSSQGIPSGLNAPTGQSKPWSAP
jgi:hypothetical protein